MHDIVMDELERHLSGKATAEFHGHLRTCPECSAEVAAIEDVSLLIQGMRNDIRSMAEPSPEPALGFYNRVAGRIVDNQRSEAWGLFSPGALFFRRIAFASLLTLAALGSFLVTRESSAGGADAAAIMAQHDVTSAHPESSDRDHLLVTLANYRE